MSGIGYGDRRESRGIPERSATEGTGQGRCAVDPDPCVPVPPGSGRQGRPIWAASTLRATGMGSGRSGDLAGPWVVHINMARLSKPPSLPNACQTLRKEGWRAPILEARRRVSPSNFQRPARPRPDFRTVEAIKRFTPRPPAPRTARPCPQGFQGPQVTPSPQLRADASTRSHISAHGWAALIRRRSSRAERANSAES